jgi:hypothetical protein
LAFACIGMHLGDIAKANPEVAIGSYPCFDPQHGPNTAGAPQQATMAHQE